MDSTGLKEVKNPSAMFLNRAEKPSSGSVVTVLWEGTRPLLVEIQALVTECQYGNPSGWPWVSTKIAGHVTGCALPAWRYFYRTG